MSKSATDALAAIDLFSGLSSRQLKSLIAVGREVTTPAGKVVAQEGLGALAFHAILDGSAEVSLKGTVIRTLGPGQSFGEISMIDGKPRSATVTAATDLTVFAVPHDSFTTLVKKDADLAFTLLVALCGRLRDAEARG